MLPRSSLQAPGTHFPTFWGVDCWQLTTDSLPRTTWVMAPPRASSLSVIVTGEVQRPTLLGPIPVSSAGLPRFSITGQVRPVSDASQPLGCFCQHTFTGVDLQGIPHYTSCTQISSQHLLPWEPDPRQNVTYIFMKFYIVLFLLIFFKKLILEREKGQEKERKETSICCSTHLCIHWLLLVGALTGVWTRNLGILGQWCNQVSYYVRAILCDFKITGMHAC